MNGKKRGPKPRYEEEDVLEAMAVYFYEHMVVRKEDLSVFTMDAIYDDIQHDASQSILYRNVAFPKYSRMRKMLIDHLSAYGLYQEKERLTAAVASRIIETYEIDAEKEDMDVLLSNHYTLTTYGGPVITCIAKLPAVEALDTLARIESKEKTEVPDLEQNQHAPQTVSKNQKKKCRCDLSSDPAVQQSDLPESKRQDR